MTLAQPSVHFLLIKEWTINVDGQPVLQRNNKARALLTYLAVHRNRPITREHLQTLLWSDSTPKRGRSSLRKALSQINRVCFKQFGSRRRRQM